MATKKSVPALPVILPPDRPPVNLRFSTAERQSFRRRFHVYQMTEASPFATFAWGCVVAILAGLLALTMVERHLFPYLSGVMPIAS